MCRFQFYYRAQRAGRRELLFNLAAEGVQFCRRRCSISAPQLFNLCRRIQKQALVNGAVLAVKIEQIADENGISFKTFKRAREIIGAIAFRRDGKWYWDMPIEAVYTESEQTAGQADSGQDCPTTALAVIRG